MELIKSEIWNKNWVARLELESTETKIARLERQLAAARKWYDAEFPAEDGHDQVYPWDHA